jgi:hypothetical protein
MTYRLWLIDIAGGLVYAMQSRCISVVQRDIGSRTHELICANWYGVNR